VQQRCSKGAEEELGSSTLVVDRHTWAARCSHSLRVP
jgi:hypothetical protein